MSRRSVSLLSFTFLLSSVLPGGTVASAGAAIVAEPIATGLEAAAFCSGCGLGSVAYGSIYFNDFGAIYRLTTG